MSDFMPNGHWRIWVYDLTGPYATWFSARGYVTGAFRAEWGYANIDGLPQAAYRVRLWQWDDDADEWAEQHDTDWIESGATVHNGSGIPDGEYLCTLELRDTEDEENGYWHAHITIGEEAPPVIDEPPTAEIVYPQEGQQVAGTVQVAMQATDDVGLSWVRLQINGQQVAAWSPGGVGVREWSRVYAWDTTGAADGQRIITLFVTDSAGQTASATVTVTVANAVGPEPPPETRGPEIAFQAPLDGATISGVYRVRLRATDDAGLYRVVLRAGGVQVRQWAPGGLGAIDWQGTYSLDTWAYENAPLVLEATAWDTAGNDATATITVTVDNVGEPGERVFVTVPLTADNAWPVVAAGATARLALATVQRGAIPDDPRERLNVRIGYHSPGTSLNWEDYTQISPRRAFRPTIPFRLMMLARPQVAWWTWTRDDCEEFIRILDCDGRIILVGNAPPSVWELRRSGLLLLTDLDDTLGVASITEAAYREGKVYLATDLGPVSYDLDEQDLPIIFRFEAAAAACEAVAASEAVAYLRIGTNLYRFIYPEPRLLSETAPDGPMGMAGDSLYAASAAGIVYRWSGTAWQELYDAEEDAARIWARQVGGQWEAWLGAEDSAHTSNPQWRQDGTWEGAGAFVRAFAEFEGRLWAAGEVGGLWRREADGWALFDALEGMVAVHDMLADEEEGRLLIVGQYDDEAVDKARLLSLRIDEGGQFICGQQCPDIFSGILTATRAV